MSSDPRPLGEAMREALPTYEAPESLRAWARAQAALEPPAAVPVRRMPRGLRLVLLAAGLVLAAGIGSMSERYLLTASLNVDAPEELIGTLVDAHVRSLIGSHLTDVASSDRHSVKPWFAGKVSFAPSVPDLSGAGFPLVGGRVEYLNGHDAVALVYGRRLHMVNLFMWPDAGAATSVSSASLHGYSLIHWGEPGWSYWAVTDASAADLQVFMKAFSARDGVNH